MRHTIEERNGRFNVYQWDKYPRHSVLAGQPRKSWLEDFDTLKEARETYPNATPGHRLLDPQNTFHHLLNGPDL